MNHKTKTPPPTPATLNNRRKTLDRRRKSTRPQTTERRQKSRRAEDKLNYIIYYTMLGVMVWILLLWAATIELLKGLGYVA